MGQQQSTVLGKRREAGGAEAEAQGQKQHSAGWRVLQTRDLVLSIARFVGEPVVLRELADLSRELFACIKRLDAAYVWPAELRFTLSRRLVAEHFDQPFFLQTLRELLSHPHAIRDWSLDFVTRPSPAIEAAYALNSDSSLELSWQCLSLLRRATVVPDLEIEQEWLSLRSVVRMLQQLRVQTLTVRGPFAVSPLLHIEEEQLWRSVIHSTWLDEQRGLTRLLTGRTLVREGHIVATPLTQNLSYLCLRGVQLLPAGEWKTGVHLARLYPKLQKLALLRCNRFAQDLLEHIKSAPSLLDVRVSAPDTHRFQVTPLTSHTVLHFGEVVSVAPVASSVLPNEAPLLQRLLRVEPGRQALAYASQLPVHELPPRLHTLHLVLDGLAPTRVFEGPPLVCPASSFCAVRAELLASVVHLRVSALAFATAVSQSVCALTLPRLEDLVLDLNDQPFLGDWPHLNRVAPNLKRLTLVTYRMAQQADSPCPHCADHLAQFALEQAYLLDIHVPIFIVRDPAYAPRVPLSPALRCVNHYSPPLSTPIVLSVGCQGAAPAYSFDHTWQELAPFLRALMDHDDFRNRWDLRAPGADFSDRRTERTGHACLNAIAYLAVLTQPLDQDQSHRGSMALCVLQKLESRGVATMAQLLRDALAPLLELRALIANTDTTEAELNAELSALALDLSQPLRAPTTPREQLNWLCELVHCAVNHRVMPAYLTARVALEWSYRRHATPEICTALGLMVRNEFIRRGPAALKVTHTEQIRVRLVFGQWQHDIAIAIPLLGGEGRTQLDLTMDARSVPCVCDSEEEDDAKSAEKWEAETQEEESHDAAEAEEDEVAEEEEDEVAEEEEDEVAEEEEEDEVQEGEVQEEDEATAGEETEV